MSLSFIELEAMYQETFERKSGQIVNADGSPNIIRLGELANVFDEMRAYFEEEDLKDDSEYDTQRDVIRNTALSPRAQNLISEGIAKDPTHRLEKAIDAFDACLAKDAANKPTAPKP